MSCIFSMAEAEIVTNNFGAAIPKIPGKSLIALSPLKLGQKQNASSLRIRSKRTAPGVICHDKNNAILDEL